MKAGLNGSKPGPITRDDSPHTAKVTPSVARFDPETDQWRTLQPPSSASLADATKYERNDDLESGTSSPSPLKEKTTYPEGGLKAWLVVLGSFSGMTAGFGYMNLIATYQAYISHNQLEGYNESTIGWIFSVYACLSFFGGILIGPIFDAYGPRWLIAAGSVSLLLSVFLMSICTGKFVRVSIVSKARANTHNSILALHAQLRHPRRPWYSIDLHTIRISHWPLVHG